MNAIRGQGLAGVDQHAIHHFGHGFLRDTRARRAYTQSKVRVIALRPWTTSLVSSGWSDDCSSGSARVPKPLDLGTAFFDEEYRERYNSNFLLTEGPLDGVPVEALLGEVDRILGEAGYQHRGLLIRDDAAGERYAPAFTSHGYKIERNAIMVHRREPDRASDLPVEEVSFAEVRDLIHEVYRREPKLDSDEIMRLFTEQHGKNERVIGARFFAVRLGGQLAGDCELYVDGSDAQVEYVRSSAAEAWLAPSSSGRSRPRSRPALATSSSWRTTMTGPRSSMSASASTGSVGPGSSSGNRRARPRNRSPEPVHHGPPYPRVRSFAMTSEKCAKVPSPPRVGWHHLRACGDGRRGPPMSAAMLEKLGDPKQFVRRYLQKVSARATLPSSMSAEPPPASR
ncbi:MAG: hypothetical protein ACR2L4_01010 [Actinomycetota bacterium]